MGTEIGMLGGYGFQGKKWQVTVQTKMGAGYNNWGKKRKSTSAKTRGRGLQLKSA